MRAIKGARDGFMFLLFRDLNDCVAPKTSFSKLLRESCAKNEFCLNFIIEVQLCWSCVTLTHLNFYLPSLRTTGGKRKTAQIDRPSKFTSLPEGTSLMVNLCLQGLTNIRNVIYVRKHREITCVFSRRRKRTENTLCPRGMNSLNIFPSNYQTICQALLGHNIILYARSTFSVAMKTYLSLSSI